MAAYVTVVVVVPVLDVARPCTFKVQRDYLMFETPNLVGRLIYINLFKLQINKLINLKTRAIFDLLI